MITWLRIPGMLCTADVFTPLDRWLELPGAMVEVPVEGSSLDEAAAHLLDVAGDIRGPVAALGLSLGAIVAMAAASTVPSAFVAIVVMSTNASAPRPDQQVQWRQQAARASAGEFPAVIAQTLPALFATDPADADLSSRATTMALATGPVAFRRQLAVQQSRRDLVPGLGDVGSPTLVIAGAADRLCPVERHREIADALQHGQLTVLPDVGHLLPLEAPQSAAGAINAWWRSVADADGKSPHSVTAP